MCLNDFSKHNETIISNGIICAPVLLKNLFINTKCLHNRNIPVTITIRVFYKLLF